jgi:hypothetical protein
LCQTPSGQHALYYIGSIKTVNTVGPEHPILKWNQSSIPFEQKTAKFILFMSQSVNQDTQPIPS